MSEELRDVHGFDIPSKGEKVTFTNLGKSCKATGDGIHSCYELSGHHKCSCCKAKPAKVKEPKAEPKAKKGKN